MPGRSIALRLLFCFILAANLVIQVETQAAEKKQRPNILFAIADDWGWPHAGAYGDPVVKTPTFDRLAREGVLFQHAYVSSPSCTPSRGAILTGKYHWQLEAGANLHCIFPDKFETYPEILKAHGYRVGHTGKAWGPGRTETRSREIAGKRFKNFEEFLGKQEEGAPFCFWLGSSDPHRPYEPGSGLKSGMDLSKIKLPACFPDAPEVRSDVADYYWEVQRFDKLVGDALALLEQKGELDNTIIFMTGDHGMPFPRSKSCLYDTGTRVPLAARWPAKIQAGRSVTDFVSLIDLAPTFYEAAGIT
nr:sulfatase [Planctomycetota bacterium]